MMQSVVEEAALAWLAGAGWSIEHGPDLAADGPRPEPRDPGYRDTTLDGRLFGALRRFNPGLPADASTMHSAS
jgi:type I restriction enzyme R subunit